MEKYGMCNPSAMGVPYRTENLKEYRHIDLYSNVKVTYKIAVCERLCYQDERCNFVRFEEFQCSFYTEGICPSSALELHMVFAKTGMY